MLKIFFMKVGDQKINSKCKRSNHGEGVSNSTNRANITGNIATPMAPILTPGHSGIDSEGVYNIWYYSLQSLDVALLATIIAVEIVCPPRGFAHRSVCLVRCRILKGNMANAQSELP
jgi:hypothetical protein